jgi:hypothetical protein
MEQVPKASLTGGKKWNKKLASWSRWLHIYLSLFSFIALLFFAVTGITLNHTEWISHQQHTTSIKDSLQKDWVNGPDTNSVNKLMIVETIRNRHHVKGSLSEFVTDEYQCTLSFNGPGYSADIFVNRENGVYELSETTTGWVGVLNDLHKGRDSGKVWAWLIDVSAIFMLLVSLTGLIMLFYLKKKRIPGLLVMAIGGALLWLLYWLAVP